MGDCGVKLRNDGYINTIGTGVFVRAQDEKGIWGSHDICFLDAKSLGEWMRQQSKSSLEICLFLSFGFQAKEHDEWEIVE